MDPINILTGVVFIVTFFANMQGAKKGAKSSVTNVKERPKSYLQKVPLNLSMFVMILIVLGIFGIGTIEVADVTQYIEVRIAGLAMFALFAALQVWALKSLGDNYTHEVVILKNQALVVSGPYKIMRHPQYLFQLLSELGAGLALLSYLVVPIVILIEVPLFIMRARMEEKMLAEYFGEEHAEYKKKSGFFLPFI